MSYNLNSGSLSVQNLYFSPSYSTNHSWSNVTKLQKIVISFISGSCSLQVQFALIILGDIQPVDNNLYIQSKAKANSSGCKPIKLKSRGKSFKPLSTHKICFHYSNNWLFLFHQGDVDRINKNMWLLANLVKSV